MIRPCGRIQTAIDLRILSHFYFSCERPVLQRDYLRGIFNKIDLFKEKISTVDIARHWDGYTGKPGDADDGIAFFANNSQMQSRGILRMRKTLRV